jgi:hypothetical protein
LMGSSGATILRKFFLYLLPFPCSHQLLTTRQKYPPRRPSQKTLQLPLQPNPPGIPHVRQLPRTL